MRYRPSRVNSYAHILVTVIPLHRRQVTDSPHRLFNSSILKTHFKLRLQAVRILFYSLILNEYCIIYECIFFQFIFVYIHLEEDLQDQQPANSIIRCFIILFTLFIDKLQLLFLIHAKLMPFCY